MKGAEKYSSGGNLLDISMLSKYNCVIAMGKETGLE